MALDSSFRRNDDGQSAKLTKGQLTGYGRAPRVEMPIDGRQHPCEDGSITPTMTKLTVEVPITQEKRL